MLSKDDLTLDDARTVEQNWLHYMSSFSLWTPTEGFASGSTSAVHQAIALCQRQCRRRRCEPNPLRHAQRTRDSHLPPHVQALLAHGTEDVFVRIRPEEEKAELDRKATVVNKRRAQRWDEWLSARRQAIDNPDGVAGGIEEGDGQNAVKVLLQPTVLLRSHLRRVLSLSLGLRSRPFLLFLLYSYRLIDSYSLISHCYAIVI